jgi:SAM-dependent methyltransferase
VNSCCASVSAADRQFSGKHAAKDVAHYRANGPGSTARLLLAGIARAGPLHGRLLDVGSGVGALTFELLDQGMTSAVGVDLSSAYIGVARDEAARRARSGVTQFIRADFVDIASDVQSADVLVLDRVVCCYPACDRLLAESLRHADRCIGISYPRDVWYVRTWVGMENAVRRVLGNPFRTFVHSAMVMENAIRGAGFALSRSCTRLWCADVYARS